MKKSRLIAKLKTLPRGWKVSFTINPFGTLAGLSNILHATIGKNNEKYGDMTPAVWFHSKSTKLHIVSAVNGFKGYTFNSRQIPLHKNSSIQIHQVQSKTNHQYYYQIFINGKKVHDVLNKDPRVFKDVKYYASDPWYNPAHATISNFKLAIFKHKGKFFVCYGYIQ